MKAEWSDRSTSQGTSRIASKPPANRGEDETDSPSEPSKGTSPAHILTLDFFPPELWDSKFLLF